MCLKYISDKKDIFKIIYNAKVLTILAIIYQPHNLSPTNTYLAHYSKFTKV